MLRSIILEWDWGIVKTIIITVTSIVIRNWFIFLAYLLIKGRNNLLAKLLLIIPWEKIKENIINIKVGDKGKCKTLLAGVFPNIINIISKNTEAIILFGYPTTHDTTVTIRADKTIA
jgi:hypothetical protein